MDSVQAPRATDKEPVCWTYEELKSLRKKKQQKNEERLGEAHHKIYSNLFKLRNEQINTKQILHTSNLAKIRLTASNRGDSLKY